MRKRRGYVHRILAINLAPTRQKGASETFVGKPDAHRGGAKSREGLGSKLAIDYTGAQDER
jgi:hypothetical protein